MTFGKNDMQRINGLRIEEEDRRRAEETQARLAHGRRGEIAEERNRLGKFFARLRSAFRR